MASAQATTMVPAAPSTDKARFEYRGSSALKVQNPANGHRYEFATPGAAVFAEAADVSWLASFPWLNRIR
jgi:hypothetical protein